MRFLFWNTHNNSQVNQTLCDIIWNNSQALTPFWHMYDQVMIRLSLQHVFVENSLKILTNAGIDSLLDANGRPNIKFSDHLPIIFELREE